MMNRLTRYIAIMLLSALTACGGSSGSNEPTSPSGYTAPSTDYPAAVTHNTAKLVGSFTNPGGYTTTTKFEYGTTTAYGSNTPSTDFSSQGAISVETNIPLLQPSTTYHFRLVTTNSGGTWYGKDIAFTTEALGYPAPSTDYATDVTHNSAKLVGSLLNQNGYTSTTWIEYGTTAVYGSKTPDMVYASVGPANVAVNIATLQPGTTYHFRLATSNAGGTWYGQDSTFTTLSQNETGAATGSATNIYDTYATLTGSFLNFSGNTTSQRFEYGTTTVYGSTTPATNYSSLGTVNVATNIVGLTPNTTYHFRLVTSNTGGTWYGFDNTFKTEASGYTAPTTDYYSKIEHNFAQLVGSFSNPPGYTTTSWIEYGTTAVYGSKTPDMVYASAGPANVAVNIASLQPGTTYHFRLATSNAGGTWYGQDSTFTTLSQNETGAATGSATNIYDTYATLTGYFANFAGNTTSQWFEYGTTTAYGSTTPATNYSSPGAVNIASNITSLQPNTTYHFRLVTSNSGGTWYGFDNTFTTEAIGFTGPSTDYATSVAHSSAKLLGHFLNPVGYTSASWIEYGTTTSYGSATLATNYAAPGSISVATNISLLQPGTTYHFRLATSNTGGTWYGADNTFTTLSPNDTGATTGNAINVYNTSATLTGSFANSPGNTTMQWFEYGPTTAYGTSTSGVNYTSPGATNAAANITGLTPNTPYHFRLVTSNAAGTWYGSDNTFTTPAALQTPATIYTSPVQVGPQQIAMDATNIYWTEIAYPLTATSGSVKSMPIAGGAVTTLATNLNAPFGIAVDATSVYFTEEGGTLKKVALGGGGSGCTLTITTTVQGKIATTTLSAGGTGYSVNETLNVAGGNGGQVLVTSVGAGGTVTGVVLNLAANPDAEGTGYAAATVATTSGGVLLFPLTGSGLTLDTTTTVAGNISTVVINTGGTGYSVNEILNVVGGTGGQVLVTSVGAGGAVTGVTLIVAGTCYTAASGVATTLRLNNPQYIAVDANNVYFTEYGTWNTCYGIQNNDGTINKVPIGGGARSVLASVLDGPKAIAIDATNIYWVEVANSVASAGAVKSVPIAGGAVSPLVPSGLSGSQHIGIDAGSIYYWQEYGTLAKVAKAGGAPTVLVTGMSGTQPIAVDGTHVYWADASFGSPLKKTPVNGGNVTVIATGAASPVSMVMDATYIYWVGFDPVTSFWNPTYAGQILKALK